MTTFRAGPALAISWFPSTIGGFILVMSLLFAFSWWLTGRIFRERDQTTTLFRGMVSFIACSCIALFHYASVNMILHGPLAEFVKTKAERDAPLQENMRKWVLAEAYDACWNPSATDSRKPAQKPPAKSKDFDARPISPAFLVGSALRGLTWMAMEHRRSPSLGRSASPHAERGTKVLNDFNASQAQAMFDYILMVSPETERDARPFLQDALAYCRESAQAVPVVAQSAEQAEKKASGRYPSIVIRRETPRGGEFVVRTSATQTRVIEAASEEEALKIARQP